MLVFYLLRLLLTSLWGVLSIFFIALILSQYCLFFLLFYMPFSCRFYVPVFLLFFKLQNYDIFFNFRNLFLFVHQVGRISFTKLAVFHSPSWPYFVHQVGRISFTKLAVFHSPSWPYFIHQVGRIGPMVFAEALLSATFCFFVCRGFDCAEYGAGDG